MIELKEASAEGDGMWRETAWDELSRGMREGPVIPPVRTIRAMGLFTGTSALSGIPSTVGPLAFTRLLRAIWYGAEVRAHLVAGQPLGRTESLMVIWGSPLSPLVRVPRSWRHSIDSPAPLSRCSASK